MELLAEHAVLATIEYGSSESGVTCRIASSVTATGCVKSNTWAARVRMVSASHRSASMYSVAPASWLSGNARV